MLFDMEMARRESLSKVILNSKREIGKKRSFANRILVNPISRFIKSKKIIEYTIKILIASFNLWPEAESNCRPLVFQTEANH